MTGIWFFVVFEFLRTTYHKTQNPVEACYDLRDRDRGKEIYSIRRYNADTKKSNRVECEFNENGNLTVIWEGGRP